MSDKTQFSGVLIKKRDAQTFASGFKKREFVVSDMHDKYPQEIPFELIKDKCDIIDTIEVGAKITVSYNLRGNYWEPKDRYFVSLQAWKIELIEQGTGDNPAKAKGEESWDEFDKKADAKEDETDEIPF